MRWQIRILKFVGVVFIFLVCWALIRHYVLDYYRVATNGMFPNIRAGALVWGYKLAYKNSTQVKRGDIIYCHLNIEGIDGVYPRRVIGLPGDTIEIRHTDVFLNGLRLPQAHVRTEGEYEVYQEKIDEIAYEIAIHRPVDVPPISQRISVPANCFYVLADNRIRAHGSQHFGVVPFAKIDAKGL